VNRVLAFESGLIMKKIETRVVETFENTWHATPDVISQAPGRINIIGEHVDYTGGYVLPAAIDRTIVITAKRTRGKKIRGYSLNYRQEVACAVGNYDRQHHALWFRYVLGVLYELEQSGYRVPGFDFCLGGDIPISAGLSSSAALGIATLTTVEGLTAQKIEDKEAALICQRAENNFVGVNCGIMDMFVSRVARKDQAVLIDCTNLTWRGVDVSLP
jgi:galactokinase